MSNSMTEKRRLPLLAMIIFALGMLAGGLIVTAFHTERNVMPTASNDSEVQDSATMFHNWDKIQLTIKGPEEVELGKPVEIEVTLHNGDATWDMVVNGGDRLKPLGLNLYDHESQLPRSKRGKELLRPTSLGYSMGGPTVTTRPATTRIWHVDLAECYDLTPGVYMLTAAVDVWANDSVNQKEFWAALKRPGAMIDGREITSDALQFVVK